MNTVKVTKTEYQSAKSLVSYIEAAKDGKYDISNYNKAIINQISNRLIKSGYAILNDCNLLVSDKARNDLPNLKQLVTSYVPRIKKINSNTNDMEADMTIRLRNLQVEQRELAQKISKNSKIISSLSTLLLELNPENEYAQAASGKGDSLGEFIENFAQQQGSVTPVNMIKAAASQERFAGLSNIAQRVYSYLASHPNKFQRIDRGEYMFIKAQLTEVKLT